MNDAFSPSSSGKSCVQKPEKRLHMQNVFNVESYLQYLFLTKQTQIDGHSPVQETKKDKFLL